MVRQVYFTDLFKHQLKLDHRVLCFKQDNLCATWKDWKGKYGMFFYMKCFIC